MWGAHKAGGEAVERIGLPLYQIRVLSLEDAASPLTSCKLREYAVLTNHRCQSKSWITGSPRHCRREIETPNPINALV
jgi:hypothetical protein